MILAIASLSRRKISCLVVSSLATASIVHGQDSAQAVAAVAAQNVAKRPGIHPDRRFEEDWSVLADPRVAREPLDGLKYIPLRLPGTFLSIGVNVRERLELNHATFFGIPPGQGGQWILSRVELHSDLRIATRVQVFAQLQNEDAPGKPVPGPPDQNKLDFEQAFIGVTEPFGGGTAKLRIGRQVLPMDFQRFVSIREGPNVRQSYDAVYADYQRGPWRVTGGYTQPVETRDRHAFDDFSSQRFTFSSIRMQRHFSEFTVTGLYALYRRDAAVFTSVSGDERRHVADIRFTGAADGFDWDIEGMTQHGRIADHTIAAGATGLSVGYTLDAVSLTPRLGLGVDIATGDRNPDDNRLETFNPLFPNGYYLADYTGFPNLIHVKPSVTFHPAPVINLTAAVAGQWRETTADAVYVFPALPVRGTAGTPRRYTGAYGELRGNWTITSHYSVLLDAIHYAIGDAIRSAGGHDADYFGLQISFAW